MSTPQFLFIVGVLFSIKSDLTTPKHPKLRVAWWVLGMSLLVASAVVKIGGKP